MALDLENNKATVSAPDRPAGGGWQSRILLFAGCLGLWLLLTGSVDPEEVTAGVLVSLGVAAVSSARLHLLDGVVLSASLPLGVLRYLGAFIVALLRANLDVARRVLTPSLPIRPAVVEIRTGLESELGRLILANSITLTPGTLAVEVDGDRMLVHWIDCPPGMDAEGATRAIASGFEGYLRAFLR